MLRAPSTRFRTRAFLAAVALGVGLTGPAPGGADAASEAEWRRLTAEGWKRLEENRPREAERLLRDALVLAERLWPDQPQVAGSLAALATVHTSRHEWLRAEPLYRRALGILEKSLGRDRPELANTLEAYAVVVRQLGRASEADVLNARAKALRARLPETDWQRRIQEGMDAFQAGRPADAERNLRGIIAELEEQAPGHPLRIRATETLAGIEEEGGRTAEADALYRQTLTLRERLFGPDHPSLMVTLQSYARLLRALGREAEAAALDARFDEVRKKNAARKQPGG